MNKMKFMVLFMSITMIFSGCASMNNTGKVLLLVAVLPDYQYDRHCRRIETDGDYTNDDFTAVTSNKVDATLSYASFDAIKPHATG